MTLRQPFVARNARLGALLCGACAAFAQTPQLDHFERKIRPVLIEKCEACHSSKLDEPMGGLRVDSREAFRRGGATGPALVPGQPEQSLLMKALRYNDPALKMPPTGKLSDREVADFETWISDGAEDPRAEELKVSDQEKPDGPGTPIEEGRKWWAFQPLRESPPPTDDSDCVRKKVDAFVLSKLRANDFQPSPEADRHTLVRPRTRISSTAYSPRLATASDGDVTGSMSLAGRRTTPPANPRIGPSSTPGATAIGSSKR